MVNEVTDGAKVQVRLNVPVFHFPAHRGGFQSSPFFSF